MMISDSGLLFGATLYILHCGEQHSSRRTCRPCTV